MVALPPFLFLAPDVNVYLVYAGQHRKHLQQFLKGEAVFLELPDFPIGIASLPDTEMLRAIRMAKEIERWRQGARPDAPSRNLASYSAAAPDARTPAGRSIINDLSSANLLFREAKKGDIVLCMPIGHYEEVLVGILEGDAGDLVSVRADHLSNEKVPARKVRWVNTGVARRNFPAEVARRLQNRRAVTRIDESFYPQIFETVFNSYLWDKQSKLQIFAKHDTNDPTRPLIGAELIRWAIAVAIACERGDADLLGSMTPDQISDTYFDEGFIDNYRMVFNSPGIYTILARNAAIVLMAGSLISATLSSDSDIVWGTTQTKIEKIFPTDDPKTNIEPVDVSGVVASISPVVIEQGRSRYGEKARQKLDLTVQPPNTRLSETISE